ncbi:MAG: DUF58 domain-containing protein [Cytophagales bacterium]|nr:DUF58 domain-containing protein [Cytophagales bacterium]
MKEILKKLRKYDIRIRKAINSQMQGDFRSIFKGSGLEYDDVRAYQYGDDIRSINWKVTAKGHGTFIKTYIEEKEQTVFFVMDVSASQEIGRDGKYKKDVAKEVTALLSISATRQSSQTGLLCFSDQKELYIKPGKGRRHQYEILSGLFNLVPKSQKTNLAEALKLTLNIIKRKSVIFLISDFIDDDYMHNLKGMARKHDLVVIHLYDEREFEMPNLGIVPLLDKESGKTLWVNTSAGGFRDSLDKTYRENTHELERFCNRNNVNYMAIDVHEDYVPKLIKLFRHRNRNRRG